MDLKLFTKIGCGPCIPIKRIAENIDNVTIISLDDHPECVDEYNLMSTPSLIKDGVIITSPSEIVEILNQESLNGNS